MILQLLRSQFQGTLKRMIDSQLSSSSRSKSIEVAKPIIRRAAARKRVRKARRRRRVVVMKRKRRSKRRYTMMKSLDL